MRAAAVLGAHSSRRVGWFLRRRLARPDGSGPPAAPQATWLSRGVPLAVILWRAH